MEVPVSGHSKLTQSVMLARGDSPLSEGRKLSVEGRVNGKASSGRGLGSASPSTK